MGFVKNGWRCAPQQRGAHLFLTPQVQPGDVVLIMTNGSFGDLHDRLLHSLRQSE